MVDMDKSYLKRIIEGLHMKSWHVQRQGNFATLYKEGAFPEALAALSNMMKNPPPWATRDGDLYTLWAELELMVNENAPRALQLLDTALNLGCSMMGYYYRTLAQAMLKTGDRETALRYLEKSVEEEPTVANLTDLGQVLSHAGDTRATSVWEKLLEKDPKNCLAHIYIGLEAAEAGDQGKAILMAKRAERLNPLVEDIFEIGRLYHYAGEVQSALSSYLEAAKRGYSDKGMLYACIASCYFSLRNDNLARKYAEWAMQSDPQNDYVKEIWQDVQTIGQDKSSLEDS